MILGLPRSHNNSFCKLNLRGDGSNNGTTFIDSSPYGKSATRVGTNIKTSTSYKKFGTASLYCSTSAKNNGLSFPDHADWIVGTNVWAVEFWAYITNTSNNSTVYMQYEASTYHYVHLRNSTFNDDSTQGYSGGGNRWLVRTAGGNAAYTSSSFTHFYMECNGTTIQMYRNGVKQSMTVVTALNGSPVDVNAVFLIISHPTAAQSFVGYLDGFRWYKGSRPHTNNFKVETRAA